VSTNKISIVVPTYRSADSIESLVNRVSSVMVGMNREWEIIFVDDCSPDDSWNVLTNLRASDESRVKIIRLLVNGGQHNAILCGFSFVTGSIVITMDDDLQNPPEEIPKLVEGIEAGYDLVIGSYSGKKHSKMKNMAGGFIDNLQRRIFHLPSDFQLTSFRAIRRVVVDNVNETPSAYPYITSMLLANSTKHKNINVQHDERKYGSSTYTFRSSTKLALNLVFYYSSYPLYVIGLACLSAFLFSLGFGSWTIYKVIAHGPVVPGWASTIVTLTFFSALILLCLLIFGIYISRFNHQLIRTKTAYKIDRINE